MVGDLQVAADLDCSYHFGVKGPWSKVFKAKIVIAWWRE